MAVALPFVAPILASIASISLYLAYYYTSSTDKELQDIKHINDCHSTLCNEIRKGICLRKTSPALKPSCDTELVIALKKKIATMRQHVEPESP